MKPRTLRRFNAITGGILLGGGIWIIIAAPLESFRIVGLALVLVSMFVFLHGHEHR